MKRTLLFSLILTILSCGKQAKDSNSSNAEVKEQKIIASKPISKHDELLLDSKFASKLATKEHQSIFNRRQQNQLGISNTVYQVYAYSDESGDHYLLLTDHMKTINAQNDTLYDNIYGMFVTKKNNQLKKRSTVDERIDEDWETSIGFWNQYSELSDLNNDGMVDPILVFGTKGQNGYKDGRVKIMAYYRGKRMSIKHQNSEIKDGRLTKINKNFYGLPIQIQKAVKEKMRNMVKNGHAVFLENWEKNMEDRAVRLESNS
ncbi:hypothetical protein J8281_09180 [Aquimarina sp. U1-2]|uniref:M949_RS01915 family surface polysaccharide biosynthesis protein n=1 Tax=Aquimarina sp. U1-2 TaxID=2823141 RepID=UPI001AEC9B28|nr:hypothetical protein [Aquimarina sp. U1-2]MBP2832356.1 hypothetical protein [Aquimarina sp. U1-2]